MPDPSPALLRPEPGPATLKETRWGGSRLAALRGGPQDAGKAIGESWELSTLPGSVSRARGRDLTSVLAGTLPFLVKLIDTAMPLSIQVHPDDAFSPGRPGKEEAWVVLDAEPGAGLLAGLRDGVTREELREAMLAAHADPKRDAVLIDRLQWIDVQRGTCIVVPAGTVHAIGPGILLMEIQQPVDCTFRLFDYGSGRPLHPDEAIAATHPDARPVVHAAGDPPGTIAGRHVQLRVGRGSTSTWVAGEDDDGSRMEPRVVVVVEGAAQVTARGESEHLSAGDLVLARGAATIEADAATRWVVAGLVPSQA